MDFSGVTPLFPNGQKGDAAPSLAEASGGLADDPWPGLYAEISGLADYPPRSASEQLSGAADRLPGWGAGWAWPVAVEPGPAAASHDAPAVPSSSADRSLTGIPGTTEWPVSDPPRRELEGREDVGAEREVLLWQRWARYAAALLMGVGALAMRAGGAPTGVWMALLLLGVTYAVVVGGTAQFLRASPSDAALPRLPALVVAADLMAAAGTVYLSAPPRDYDRFLILALVVLQVAVVYYGLSFAAWGLAGTLAAFFAGSLLLPAVAPGPAADPESVFLYAATYVFAASAMFYAFGTFRVRMNALRRFCRDVEIGELGVAFDGQGERRPDDLTLLSRSVDEMRQRLLELIGTDPLTECLNRRALETRLARECRLARRRGTPLAVLAIDIDYFKSINDNFGHPFGDYVLQTVADIMTETLRDTDALARLGGDEFVVVLTDTGWQGAALFAERLRRNVDDHIFGDRTTSLEVTISVGVAVAPTIGAQAPPALLAEADRSLYRAKSSGRNRISA
jgi:diguanylate cyclase (GGDEF)-like protein